MLTRKRLRDEEFAKQTKPPPPPAPTSVPIIVVDSQSPPSQPYSNSSLSTAYSSTGYQNSISSNSQQTYETYPQFTEYQPEPIHLQPTQFDYLRNYRMPQYYSQHYPLFLDYSVNYPPLPEPQNPMYDMKSGNSGNRGKSGKDGKKEIEVIDLTITPPVEEMGVKRRKVDDGYQVNRKVAYKLPPLPSTSYDDKDGHYIVKLQDDLTPRYQIKRLLGQGTFGKVVEVLDRKLNTHRAIKIIRAIQKYRDASQVEIKVLQALKKYDPDNRFNCIHLLEWFDYRNHVCMVFELLSSSVFDFMKENSFAPFPMWQICSMAKQLLRAVEFLHVDLRLIHTDLKPENLMLENTQHKIVYGRTKRRKELLSPKIKLIDFGSAIFENDYHSSVVSTRHYRAPEIILGTSWSFPCDIWSIGCILVELYTGEALFHTHDNLEHLALMESILGAIPKNVSDMSAKRDFFTKGKLNFPKEDTQKSSINYVLSQKKLSSIIKPTSEVGKDFLDLVQKMLNYDPKKRLTAQQALKHSFFRHFD